MPNNIGTLVAAAVRPVSDQDKYPSAHANELLGGHMQVDTLVAMNAIPVERRVLLMWCDVVETGKSYKLVGADVATAVWQEVVFGSNGTVADANDVVYTNPEDPSVANVEDALNKLLYTEIKCTSFSNDVNTVEKGVTISAVNLVWALSKTPKAQSMTLPSGDVPLTVADRTLLVNGVTYTSDTSFTLHYEDDRMQKTQSTGINFRHKRYYGVSDMENIDDAGIIGLSTNEFSTSKVLHASIDGLGKYLYFAFPASFGDVKFKVNGLQNTAWTVTTRDFVNASGWTESYNIYRSNTIQNGDDILIDTY